MRTVPAYACIQLARIARLKTLSLKLYRRNPQEWRKSGIASAEEAVEALYKAYRSGSLPQNLTGKPACKMLGEKTLPVTRSTR